MGENDLTAYVISLVQGELTDDLVRRIIRVYVCEETGNRSYYI